MKVEEAMVSDVVSCRPEQSLQSVALAMWDNNCGCVPVINDQHEPIGIITDRDIAMSAALRHQPLWEVQAKDVMGNRPVYCCRVTDSLETAQRQMREHEVRRLPAVDKQGKLVGIIAMGDIVAQTDPTQKSAISFAETINMLKSVSAHHQAKTPDVIGA